MVTLEDFTPVPNFSIIANLLSKRIAYHYTTDDKFYAWVRYIENYRVEVIEIMGDDTCYVRIVREFE